MLVAVQLSVSGLYRPPVFNRAPLLSCPPQTIISVPVHTAEFSLLADGTSVVLVAVQWSVVGLYRAPVCRPPALMIISLPVHTAECSNLLVGALIVLVAVQLSVLGLYLPPVLRARRFDTPPQTIISVPVQTAV